MLNSDKLINLRQTYLSPSMSLSYNEPLNIVKGKGQFLYELNGKKYLDCVNNIQHVGHCHPKVVEASYKQSKILNTNTRYLNSLIIEYAKELTDTLPEGLDVCFFTNSGSEANDLALRIARYITQSKETIILEDAYHGNLTSLIEISPYKYNGKGGDGPPKFVHTIPRPDNFRGKYRGNNTGDKYANEVKKIVKKIQNDRNTFPVFFVEPLMGCAGQLIFPNGFLKQAFDIVRKAGGVCIADEIQIGFGRVGSHFWGFESEEVIPDIVTMGKSMGNGHPLSAVITTKEIADSFNNGMEYFNSFGGNPVSCSVGKAVLSVIKTEGLQENAKVSGAYLFKKLSDLKSKHKLIGDVRGRGLFIGIELIKGDDLSPATVEANQIINKMKDIGILLSTDGPDQNVIKIKPPMVFTIENANHLFESIDKLIELL